MKISDLCRYALSVCLAAMLAACGGAQPPMSIGQSDWADVVAAFVALVAVVVSLIAFGYTKRFNRSQVMIDFHRRFDDLTKAKYETVGSIKTGDPITPGDSPSIAGFIMRYWDMHYAQFIFWKLGLLDETIYQDWLDILHENKRQSIIMQTSYADAWSYVRESHHFHQEFARFMDVVFRRGAKEALKEFRPRPRYLRLLRSHGSGEQAAP